MLRIHFLQQSYALSHPSVEDALHDSAPMRRFAGIDLGCEPVSDEATVRKFRYLLEKYWLAEKQFKAVSQHPLFFVSIAVFYERLLRWSGPVNPRTQSQP